METVCENCGEEVPVDETSQCDHCGQDGLCQCCIGDLDHNNPETGRLCGA